MPYREGRRFPIGRCLVPASTFLNAREPGPCLDYKYGGPIRAARFLPLAPRLALWTRIEPENLPTRPRFGMRSFGLPSSLSDRLRLPGGWN